MMFIKPWELLNPVIVKIIKIYMYAKDTVLEIGFKQIF